MPWRCTNSLPKRDVLCELPVEMVTKYSSSIHSVVFGHFLYILVLLPEGTRCKLVALDFHLNKWTEFDVITSRLFTRIRLVGVHERLLLVGLIQETQLLILMTAMFSWMLFCPRRPRLCVSKCRKCREGFVRHSQMPVVCSSSRPLCAHTTILHSSSRQEASLSSIRLHRMCRVMCRFSVRYIYQIMAQTIMYMVRMVLGDSRSLKEKDSKHRFCKRRDGQSVAGPAPPLAKLPAIGP